MVVDPPVAEVGPVGIRGWLALAVAGMFLAPLSMLAEISNSASGSATRAEFLGSLVVLTGFAGVFTYTGIALCSRWSNAPRLAQGGRPMAGFHLCGGGVVAVRAGNIDSRLARRRTNCDGVASAQTSRRGSYLWRSGEVSQNIRCSPLRAVVGFRSYLLEAWNRRRVESREYVPPRCTIFETFRARSSGSPHHPKVSRRTAQMTRTA